MTTMFGFSDTSSGNGVDEVADLNGVGYSPQERSLRDLFVAEYLLDYDHIKAAQRCGFGQQLAIEWGLRFLSEPYVQLRIQRLGVGKNDDSDETVDYEKRRIREALMKEAHNVGPGSSHAARVSALKALAEIHGMVKKEVVKKPGEGPVGGVMQVPAISDLNEWEAVAAASQDALVDHAGDGE